MKYNANANLRRFNNPNARMAARQSHEGGLVYASDTIGRHYPVTYSAGMAPATPSQWDHRIPDNDTLAKQVFDRVFAAVAIVLLSPILLIVAALIKLRDPGPIIFGHERIGKSGQRFKCLKFRTMFVNGDAILAQHLRANPKAAQEWADTRKLTEDPRITFLGNVLRKSSIDELPQLWNILKGEMSVVGPRPIVDVEMRKYENAIFDYLSVRPGLTGLWQVSGRSDVGYDTRVALDKQYVRNRTMLGDIGIIFSTIKVVALRKGSR